jgi:hypothetical protein
VDIVVDGVALRLAPARVDEPELVDEDGFTVVAASGQTITEDEVNLLRDAIRR